MEGEEENQVSQQAPEDSHDSSTDSCPTLPYNSDSTRCLPLSPVHSVTDSPGEVPPLVIITDNSSDGDSHVNKSSGHDLPTSILPTSTDLILSQTSTIGSSIQATNRPNNPLQFSHASSSFSQPGPIAFPGGSSDFPYLEVPLSRMVPIAQPRPFLSFDAHTVAKSIHSKGCGRGSKGTPSGRGKISRGRRGKVTSTTSSQTSPNPNFYWINHQTSSGPLGGPSTDGVLNLSTRPRAANYYSDLLPPSPFLNDYFTLVRAAAPVVMFHCPSPFSLRSFSSVYSMNFHADLDTKAVLVEGITQ